MKALLINTKNRTVSQVDYNGDLDHIHRLIGCDAIESVNMDNDDAIYVNANGWLEYNNTGGFRYYSDKYNHMYNVAGNGLIVGTDFNTGEDMPCKTTIEEALNLLVFMNEAEAETLAEQFA